MSEATADGTPEVETTDADGAHRGARTWDDSLLAVRNLDAGYGDLQILTDVDLDVRDG